MPAGEENENYEHFTDIRTTNDRKRPLELTLAITLDEEKFIY